MVSCLDLPTARAVIYPFLTPVILNPCTSGWCFNDLFIVDINSTFSCLLDFTFLCFNTINLQRLEGLEVS